MLNSLLERLPPRRRKAARWIFWILLSYAILGFLIVPPIVRAVAVKQLSTQLNREVSIKSVRLNPFVFSATIRGLLIKDRDGQPFVSWDEFYANLQLLSFVSHPWVLREVRVVHPFVRAQMNRDGSMNFSDIIAKFSASTPSNASPSRPLSLRIGLLHVAGASAQYSDLTPSTPFERRLGPFDITIHNFRTDPEHNNPYSLAGTTEAIEKISWSGSFGLYPLRFQGDIALENMDLPKYKALYQDLVHFEIREGLVSLRATYQFEFGDTNYVVAVSNTDFGLRNFKLGAPGQSTNLVEVSDFSVSGVVADLVHRKGEIGSVNLNGAAIRVQREPDKSFNVVNAARPVESAKAPGSVTFLVDSLTNIVSQLLSSTNAITASVHKVSFTNAAILFSDVAQSRPVLLDLHDIQLEAANLSNLPGSSPTASVFVLWNTNGTIRADLTASLQPIGAEVRVALDRLDLHPLGPYLDPWLNVIFLRNDLSVHGSARMTLTNASLPQVTFQGDCQLDGLSAIDGVLGEDLLAWSSVRISGIDATLIPLTVHVKEVAVNDAAVSVLVETNHTINLLAALQPPGSTETNSSAGQVAAGKPAAEAAPDTNAGSSFMPDLAVDAVVISNASVQYIDRSVTPAVQLTIQDVNGTISELSSETLGHAAVHIEARIDQIGRAQIQGTINPFTKQKSNDVSIAVQNVDLTVGSPYSGKYAGYRIARGKLAMDLAYHLLGRNLRGENHLTLDHFTFGDKVDSPDATALPVRLGVAILKDRNGQIQLDVPVEGNLDDPEFRIHKVVMHTIVNLLTRVATSPFSLLGAVFGGHSEDINYQVFAPGSAELQASEKSKLDALAKGLYERPGLQVEIQGSVDTNADRDGLRALRLESDLRSAYWDSLSKSARAETSPDRLTIPPEERTRWIRKFYAQALKSGQIVIAQPGASAAPGAPSPPPSFRSTRHVRAAALLVFQEPPPPPPHAPAPGETVATDPYEQALLNTITITGPEFESLASTRAKVVRDYLLQAGKVEADRLYLAETKPGGLKTDGARTELQLQ